MNFKLVMVVWTPDNVDVHNASAGLGWEYY